MQRKSKNITQDFLIPNLKDLGFYLYDRFHILIKHYGVLDKDLPYTLFLNILDRSNSKSLKEEKLIYAGLKRQRELLEATTNRNADSYHWRNLDNIQLEGALAQEGGKLFKEFKDGDLELKDIKIKSLAGYLEIPKHKRTSAQKSEILILQAHNFTEKDYFVSFRGLATNRVKSAKTLTLFLFSFNIHV